MGSRAYGMGFAFGPGFGEASLRGGIRMGGDVVRFGCRLGSVRGRVGMYLLGEVFGAASEVLPEKRYRRPTALSPEEDSRGWDEYRRAPGFGRGGEKFGKPLSSLMDVRNVESFSQRGA